jgi:hypothetical protein
MSKELEKRIEELELIIEFARSLHAPYAPTGMCYSCRQFFPCDTLDTLNGER